MSGDHQDGRWACGRQTDESTTADTAPAVSLERLLADYGPDWEIAKASSEPDVWVAVSRPTLTASRVIAAHGLVELALKLSNA